MTQFTDFNFKLLVIERLMYADGTLTPRFDLGSHLVEQGLIEDDGDPAYTYTVRNGLSHQVVPAAREYFEALEISPELLASVEELVLDGGLRVYFHCSPVWDGEDDLYDVRSLDDLPLLPHLKRIRGADDFWPPEFLEVLRKRGTATDG
ncbi:MULTISPECIES: DUF6892 domain-containing protein [Streptomyces]|uniref:DUF6892 domain-containing protein n=1 Tax=Streptomyces ardesiacus TaxID=285564 RepID=A0ABW8HGQ4_9ACTN|nr:MULTISPECIES: hypothetical protein [Streptomyces]MCL7365966.1 hypothetical protein [Streptomyces ardesiacus]NEB59380.1 hypothetical protein [Streptomyces diastaticus]